LTEKIHDPGGTVGGFCTPKDPAEAAIRAAIKVAVDADRLDLAEGLLRLLRDAQTNQRAAIIPLARRPARKTSGPRAVVVTESRPRWHATAECHLAKLNVEGSNPFSRSTKIRSEVFSTTS
jgi:hypothetical protein